jgi:hypothetical protein
MGRIAVLGEGLMTPRMGFLGATILLLGHVAAAGQSVRFDVPGFAEGREQADLQFDSLHPNEKLVKFSLDVAAHSSLGREREISAIVARFRIQAPGATIVDFCPKSEAVSAVDGVISVERIEEQNANLGYQIDTGPSLSWQAGTSGSLGGKQGESIRFDAKPDQQLLISSGLIDRGTGVSIQWLRTPQHPLENARPVRLTLRLPKTWRTGLLQVECHAVTRKKNSLLGDASYDAADISRFLVPVFVEGDEPARLHAIALHDAELALRAAVKAERETAVRKNSWEDLARLAYSGSKPPVRSDWVDRLLADIGGAHHRAPADLPREVSVALKDFVHGKQSFLALGEASPATSVVLQSDQWKSKRTE